jgi:hypothetical protein
MESFVEHPEAEHVRPWVAVGEAGGIFPGRLPFISLRRRRACPPLGVFARKGGSAFETG